MRKLNPRHVESVIELINRGPYIGLLSMVIKELGKGHCHLQVDLEVKHLNPFGGIHGGVYASLMDTAAFWAAYGELDEDAGWVSLDLKANYLAPVKQGKLLVRGQTVKMGKTLGLAESVVSSLDGKILAQGTSTLMITHGMQRIRDAVGLANWEKLPPKFIEH